MSFSVDDKELAMTLLASLSEEFKALISALDDVGEDNVSFDKVKGMPLNDADGSLGNLCAKKSEDDFSGGPLTGHNKTGDKLMAHMDL